MTAACLPDGRTEAIPVLTLLEAHGGSLLREDDQIVSLDSYIDLAPVAKHIELVGDRFVLPSAIEIALKERQGHLAVLSAHYFDTLRENRVVIEGVAASGYDANGRVTALKYSERPTLGVVWSVNDSGRATIGVRFRRARFLSAKIDSADGDRLRVSASVGHAMTEIGDLMWAIARDVATAQRLTLDACAPFNEEPICAIYRAAHESPTVRTAAYELTGVMANGTASRERIMGSNLGELRMRRLADGEERIDETEH